MTRPIFLLGGARRNAICRAMIGARRPCGPRRRSGRVRLQAGRQANRERDVLQRIGDLFQIPFLQFEFDIPLCRLAH